MSSSDEGGSSSSPSVSHQQQQQQQQRRLKGIRRRKWGKWVSEIRVPGTQDRLWLGTYSTPEAAAVAHDIAKYCLRENATSPEDFNFPLMIPAGAHKGMSPRSVQRVSSDAGLAVDARFLNNNSSSSTTTTLGYHHHDHHYSGNAAVKLEQSFGNNNNVNHGHQYGRRRTATWECHENYMNDECCYVDVPSSSSSWDDAAKARGLDDISVDDYL
ncbi:OLC1v1018455C1 [Oldenlandia corymbosa var. corymbosa]|uniref:OLC1v1018455C1 n=1 Tax=Oldenlandia corymbosa var. corymbosa TaxID=529605 RepID=A0AAV1EBN2_OLDCO|nr:OLC1v1018455C1 [Oldenlandia corymbosa var. corymbosa]